MTRKLILSAAMAASLAIPQMASATTFVVDAAGNSSSGGAGLASIFVTAGQKLNVTQLVPNAIWKAGALPRWSDASGIKQRIATGSEVSTAPLDFGVGDTIGNDSFGLYTQDGFSALYGSLVGKIGSTYYLLGSNSSQIATSTGTLNLFYWDSNSGDNLGSLAFDITAVPEPGTWALMLAGFGIVGFALRRRQNVRVSFA